MSRNDPNTRRWRVFLNVEIWPRAEEPTDETVFSDGGTFHYPSEWPQEKVVAEFLRASADEIDRGELEPKSEQPSEIGRSPQSTFSSRR